MLAIKLHAYGSDTAWQYAMLPCLQTVAVLPAKHMAGICCHRGLQMVWPQPRLPDVDLTSSLSACLLCLYRSSSLGAALSWQLPQLLPAPKAIASTCFPAAGEWPGVLPPEPQPAGLWSWRGGALRLEPGEP